MQVVAAEVEDEAGDEDVRVEEVFEATEEDEVADGDGSSVSDHVHSRTEVGALVEHACQFSIYSVEQLRDGEVDGEVVQFILVKCIFGRQEKEYKSQPAHNIWDIEADLEVLGGGVWGILGVLVIAIVVLSNWTGFGMLFVWDGLGHRCHF